MTTTSPTPTLPPEFVGYALYSSAVWSVILCGTDSTFTTSGSFGHCCPTSTSSCGGFFTQCLGLSTAINIYGETKTEMNSGYHCAIQTVFQRYPDVSPVSNIFWGADYFAYATSLLYREIPTIAASSLGLPTSATSNTTDGSPLILPSACSNSKSWIAAAVVAPVLALIIASLLAWIFQLRKQIKNKPAEGHDKEVGYGHNSMSDSRVLSGYSTGGYYQQPHPGELDAMRPPQEMPDRS